jgi:ABC-2 type transport system permease protein
MRILLGKELREMGRTRRFFVVVVVMFVFGLLGPLSVKYMPAILSQVPGVPEGLEGILPEPDVALAVDEFVQNLSQFGVIMAILVPMGAVVGEKSRGTAAMILSKPLSRAAFLGAKEIGYSLVFLVGVCLAGLGGYYYLGILFEWLSPLGFLALVGLIFLYLMMFVTITIFASTICQSQLAAAGVSFGVLIFLSVLGIIPSISVYLPSSILHWGRALALKQAYDARWGSLLITGMVIVLAWLGAWLVLRRQEL